MVGYNVQTAVETTHHLIVAHDVINQGNDRSQLSPMSKQATDSGYYSGEEILANTSSRCHRHCEYDR